MYGYCQKLPMPTTPGIKWEKIGAAKQYRKNVMTHSHSFVCQQWLEWQQVTDPFLLNSDGSRSQIQMKYYRGEVKLYNSRTQDFSWPVDGYAESEKGRKVYEFLGERWHRGCPECHAGELDETWERKKNDIQKMGYELEFIWGCQWRELKSKLTDLETPNFPKILSNKNSESDILNGIRDGTLFGYLICDVKSPESVIQNWRNFPPIIKRQKLDASFVSETTFEQIKSEYGQTSKFKRNTLIQCFNDENHLLFTPLARFYLGEGIEISNIRTFVQYKPSACLEPFIDKVTQMRIDAEHARKPLKGATAKIIGNSGYGFGFKIFIILITIEHFRTR